jgi:hypothetical protein
MTQALELREPLPHALAGEPDIGPFCALHRIGGALIVAVHQYLTDPDMIESLGLIP